VALRRGYRAPLRVRATLNRGYEIVRTYSDHGKSGLRVEDREALRELLSDVQSGKAKLEAVACGQVD